MTSAVAQSGSRLSVLESFDADVDVAPGAVLDRQTRRWYGISSFALLALGLGVVTQEPGLLLASAVGLAFAGYGRLTAAPTVDLSVERSVSTSSPDPGEDVTVVVTVRNDADGVLPDLRLVDGVPARLDVAEGSPRRGTVLRAGESTTIEYTVTADRGVHEFAPLTVVARDVSGATERITTVAVDDTVACDPALPAPTVEFPLRPQTSQFTGRFPADSGGPGVEFYATREYETGDPLSRINWRRTARTGELTTVEYRVERTATVVLVVDARKAAYAAPDPHDQSALERSVDAAREVAASLLADGHEVGVAAVSPEDCWVAPGRGEQHRIELRQTLGSHPALSPEEPEAGTNLYAVSQRLRQRLASDTQLVVFSPLTDPSLGNTAARWDAHGHKTTVVSPDPTGAATAGQRLASVNRTMEMVSLRRRGIPVADWDPDESFHEAVAGLQRGWSQ